MEKRKDKNIAYGKTEYAISKDGQYIYTNTYVYNYVYRDNNRPKYQKNKNKKD
jgi:hypothetical protein